MKGEGTEGGRLTAAVIMAAIVLAAALMAAGVILFLVRGGAGHPFHARSLGELLLNAAGGIFAGRPRSYVEAGLLVLLLAPLLRLAAGAIQSARRGDWRFVLTSVIVAGLLITGILLGTGG